MYQLHALKAEDKSEVRIIDKVAEKDWGRMAAALGFDESRRTLICVRALYVPDDACKSMFEHWLKGEAALKPAYDKGEPSH